MMRMASPLSVCLLPFAGRRQQTSSCQDSSWQNHFQRQQNGLESLNWPVAVATFIDTMNPLSTDVTEVTPKSVESESSIMKQGEDSFLPVRVSEAVSQKAKTLASTRFQKGNYWVWLYRDPSGKPYSWERYSVSASSHDAQVVIEMSSRFGEDEKYNTHHRMKLSLGECLASRLYHKTWRFHEFSYKSSGEWCEAPFQDNVQAFEEKFDVFLMDEEVPADSIQNSRIQTITGLGEFGPTGLVQTRRHGYTQAWYAHRPCRHAGLAAFKDFVEEHRENGSHYTFELVEMGNHLEAE